jgi:hypothetical protein
MTSIRLVSESQMDHGLKPLTCENTVSEGGVHRKANASCLVSSVAWLVTSARADRWDQVADDRVPGVDRGDGLPLTTHRPDSRSATRRIRSKSVADGVTLPEV